MLDQSSRRRVCRNPRSQDGRWFVDLRCLEESRSSYLDRCAIFGDLTIV